MRATGVLTLVGAVLIRIRIRALLPDVVRLYILHTRTEWCSGNVSSFALGKGTVYPEPVAGNRPLIYLKYTDAYHVARFSQEHRLNRRSQLERVTFLFLYMRVVTTVPCRRFAVASRRLPFVQIGASEMKLNSNLFTSWFTPTAQNGVTSKYLPQYAPNNRKHGVVLTAMNRH